MFTVRLQSMSSIEMKSFHDTFMYSFITAALIAFVAFIYMSPVNQYTPYWILLGAIAACFQVSFSGFSAFMLGAEEVPNKTRKTAIPILVSCAIVCSVVYTILMAKYHAVIG